MNQPILVTLDGSTTAEIVIPYVEEIANNLKSEIALASVSESHRPEMAHLLTAYLERLKENLQHQVKDLSGNELKVSHTMLTGNPASEILRYAEYIQAGLIVMASRGSSGKGPWLLGNVASKVLRATDNPVLLIRSPASPAALEQKKLIRKILVPLDGSSLGEAALPWVEILAQASGAEIILFHVVAPTPIRATGYDSSFKIQEVEQLEEKKEQAATISYLGEVEKRLKAKGLNTRCVVDSGYPANMIIDFAQAVAVDLIAMSTHGRSGIGRWVFGSVTDKVLHSGDTPVLVVRASKT